MDISRIEANAITCTLAEVEGVGSKYSHLRRLFVHEGLNGAQDRLVDLVEPRSVHVEMEVAIAQVAERRRYLSIESSSAVSKLLEKAPDKASEKEGQPVPLSNFAVDAKSLFPQLAQ